MWLIFFGGSCHRFTVNWVFPAVCAYSSRAVGQHPHRPTSTFLTLTRDITFCWHSPPVRDEPQCPSTSILVVPCSWCIKNTRTWSTQMLCRAYITQLQSPFDLGFVFCLQPGFKLVWMCYMGVKACGSSSSGLSLTSLTPVFSPSLLHQLIQAWSDTWASGVSAAIKMPPLHRFNWNFCCWCVNSCRTAKGRSIIPALRRPPRVKWQQLPRQEAPSAPVYLWFYCAIPPVPLHHSRPSACVETVDRQIHRESLV